MAKRKVRLNFARGNNKYAMELSITDEDWFRIEKAYKHRLSPELRQSIIEATWVFLGFVPGETSAELVKQASDDLKRVKNAAQEFRDLSTQLLNSNSYGSHLVSEEFKIQENYDIFYRHLSLFIKSCDLALVNIHDQHNHGWVAGSMWNWWIRQLTEIVKEEGLPYGARNDVDKNKTGGPSAFVVFVRELQKCVPSKFVPSQQSCGALTTAINRARRVK